jgi:hypothetical protein
MKHYLFYNIFVQSAQKFKGRIRIRPDPSLIGILYSDPDVYLRIVDPTANPDPKEIFMDPQQYSELK